MHASPQTWATRALWVTLPLTLGDLLADSLDGRSGAVRAVVVVLAWSLWACGLLASLVTRSVALTALRVVAPVPLVAAAVALLRDDVSASAAGWVGAVTAAVVLVLALSAEVGADFIDGDSYGDERRFGLRPPGVLLLGPLPAVWAAVAVPLPVAAMLLAAERWVPGVALAVVGLPDDEWAAVAARFKTVLGDRVTEVRESQLLTGSPARLVSPQAGFEREMQRLRHLLEQDYHIPPKILELNRRHPLTRNLASLIADRPADAVIDASIELLFENLLLLEGLHPNPATLAPRIQALLEQATRGPRG